MTARVPLAPLTTFKIGGVADTLLTITDEEGLHAVGGTQPFAVLGGGSNILVPDEGVRATVLKMEIGGIEFEREGDMTIVIAGAGERWDAIVAASTERGLWGIENLAGIPGSIGGAVVQNIGAYGTELDETFAYADAFDLSTGEVRRIGREEAHHAYRDSLFKQARNLVVLRVALRLGNRSVPNLSYKDLAAAERSGVPLKTPLEIAAAVRDIRALKFPDLSSVGTAGSFFKNPVLPRSEAEALARRYHGLPLFPQADEGVKLPLAWLLDHVLGLKGYAHGAARLFEKQPLVIVAERGASSADVEALAREVESRVAQELSIALEREVETFSPRMI